MNHKRCRVVRRGKSVELCAPAFAFRLDVTAGLRAVTWRNQLAGRTLRLGRAPEFGCELDAAERRLPITGWRVVNDPDGFRKGHQRPEFDDSAWQGALNPAMLWTVGDGPAVAWARTHLFVPADCPPQALTLVLGGLGVWDFRALRVYVNGRFAGARRVRDRWHEPGRFDVAQFLRFGQDNVIALELRDQVRRTRELDAIDPQHTRALAYAHLWPPQFEQYLVAGQPVAATAWRVARVRVEREGRTGALRVELRAAQRKLVAQVTYRWRADEPTLHKFLEITNRDAVAVRLMDVGLGRYTTPAAVTDGEQGFPVYADSSFFFSVAHPSGWAMGQRGTIALRQHPGRRLAPGETFTAMETVLGVAAPGGARAAFVAHVRTRSRRVRRGHARSYAIFEAYGSWKIPAGKFLGENESEQILLANARQLAAARRTAGLRFDFCSVNFWTDTRGDLSQPHPVHFPRGFGPVRREMGKLGTALGLWIDSSMGKWSIGDNPVVTRAFTDDPGYGRNLNWCGRFMCRATDPVRTIYQNAFCRHLRENGVRLLKFDNLQALCHNPSHDHLPGLYSTEAIHSSVIEPLQALDAECRDALLMLYWGYRSPWWLLHADTVFESGLCVEAASPGPHPTLYARDGVTQGLDMAAWYCADLPALGKDLLGVWLSDWPWNSMLGKERWPEGFVMELCRGNLLAQPWNGERPLRGAEWRQMATFIALLKARPKCFANGCFILGNPWKKEPYGYECRDGRRAFVALHNCTWRDRVLPIMAAGQDVYRWYPRPARLVGKTAQIALRPFEVVLLEIVPPGAPPTLPRRFATAPLPAGFREPSRKLAVTVFAQRPAQPARLPAEDVPRAKDAAPLPPKRVFGLRATVPAAGQGGTLVIAIERQKRGLAFQTHRPGEELGLAVRIDGQTVVGRPVLGPQTYPSAWQAWRLVLPARTRARLVRAQLTALLPRGVRAVCSAYFIPAGP